MTADVTAGRMATVLTLTLDDFHFDLPEELIAQRPTDRREDSRLMILDRDSASVRLARFYRLSDYLPPGALLVVNDARVVPARLWGQRPTGGQVEVVILEPPEPLAEAGEYWIECLVRPARRIKKGEEIFFGPGLTAQMVRPGREGCRVLKFTFEKPPAVMLDLLGRMPLPPYIKRPGGGPDADDGLDRERYQTVYAQNPGAVAAPTAGLHFTPAMLEELRQRGFKVVALTLFVGYGTFAPVRSGDISRHRLPAENVILSEAAAQAVNQAKKEGRPVVAVGTTTVRTMEDIGRADGLLRPFQGRTELFIYPGFEFRVVDHLITNFHLPGSTLLMLAAAFAGKEFILDAYRRAVALKFRFFSYGDATLIL